MKSASAEGKLPSDLSEIPVLYPGGACGLPRVCNRAVRLAVSVTQPPDDRSVLAKAYEWAWRIIVISFEMVLPGIAGYWVDTRIGTVCLFLVIGLAIGGFAAMRQLLQLARSCSKRGQDK